MDWCGRPILPAVFSFFVSFHLSMWSNVICPALTNSVYLYLNSFSGDDNCFHHYIMKIWHRNTLAVTFFTNRVQQMISGSRKHEQRKESHIDHQDHEEFWEQVHWHHTFMRANSSTQDLTCCIYSVIALDPLTSVSTIPRRCMIWPQYGLACVLNSIFQASMEVLVEAINRMRVREILPIMALRISWLVESKLSMPDWMWCQFQSWWWKGDMVESRQQSWGGHCQSTVY